MLKKVGSFEDEAISLSIVNYPLSIVAQGLYKSYGKEKIMAVENISFEVNRAEIFGLIGPDGAGKTTIFRMLTTLLLPDAGNATVDGFDILKEYNKIRKTVGYMPGKFSLYQDMTIEENLNFFATVFNTSLEENYELIKDIYIQIEPFKKRRAGKLSGGMKQKLALCCALIHKPTVLFLDEPTTGVDPVSRKEFWEMLKRLKQQGITILVSTPYMDEAVLCDRIALIEKGKILTIDTPEKIAGMYPGVLFQIKSDSMYRLLMDLNRYELTTSCFIFGEYLHLEIKDTEEKAKIALLEYLMLQGHENIIMEIIKPTIEDYFIKLLKA